MDAEIMEELQAVRAELAALRRFLEETRPLELLKDTEAAEMLGIGKSTFLKRVKLGMLPGKVPLAGCRDARWRLTDIRAVAG